MLSEECRRRKDVFWRLSTLLLGGFTWAGQLGQLYLSSAREKLNHFLTLGSWSGSSSCLSFWDSQRPSCKCHTSRVKLSFLPNVDFLQMFISLSWPYHVTCDYSMLKDYTRIVALDGLRLWSHNRCRKKSSLFCFFNTYPHSHFTHTRWELSFTEVDLNGLKKNTSFHCISEEVAVPFFSCSFCPNLSAISTCLHLTHSVAVSLICT